MHFYNCSWENPIVSSNQVRADLVGSELQSFSDPLFFNAGESYYLRVRNQSLSLLFMAVWATKLGDTVGKLLHQESIESGKTVNFNQRVEVDSNLVLNLSCVGASTEHCFAQGVLSKVALYVIPGLRK